MLLIVGPAIGDNALVATPLADAAGIPTINWAGTERGRSEYMFHLQVGSHEDESILLARHLADLGLRRVGVVLDRSPIGRRYAAFFETECEVLGLELAARVTIAPIAEDASHEVAALQSTGVDGIVYLGLGLSGAAVARARADAGWDAPAAMNTAGMRGYSPDYARAIDGWTYVDMHSDSNTVLRSLRERLGIDARIGALPAVAYDLGLLVAEGLGARDRAHSRGREGRARVGEARARGRRVRGHHPRVRSLGPRRTARSLPGAARVARRRIARDHLIRVTRPAT